MSNEIVYSYKDNVYLNITNKCPCACTFCIRSQKDAIGSANSLWLEHNPTFEEVKTALDNYNLDNCKEIIFCGYGEPTNSYDVLIETAKYIRENYKIKTRINTNGLGNLVNNKNIAEELCHNKDAVSISLNCSNKEDYFKVVRPKFGIESFDAMPDFARDCKKYTDNVMLSVVDVIGEEEIEKCKKIADSLNIPLRVRVFSN